ncbi:MAG: prenyltransferase/squalene oxidase repeat-containing protein [Candidatus Sulfotelmatobacter sp.]|jgi:prenyltransferase/squalene oxidase-like repeat protein
MVDSGADLSGQNGSGYAKTDRVSRALSEAAGLLRVPQRIVPLIEKLVSDKLRVAFEQRHLYSYTTTKRDSAETLNSLVRWLLDAQRADGGIAAYYSLLTGYSTSYPEVTGYIVPTLYDFFRANGDHRAVAAAERATRWLLSLQMPTGAFPGGLHGGQRDEAQPSVFNTGQILQGLVRAHMETNRPEILRAAVAAGDWLIRMQQSDGSWSGLATYQNVAHTYYSMVAWALAELSEHSGDHRHALAAEKNLDWVLAHFQPSGWIDGIDLRGHPTYLHFIAYVLQGVLECGILLRRNDAVESVANSAWVLLRKFETNKYLSGAYEADFKNGQRFTCLTGNAQMSCVWLRMFEVNGDLRYLNAALKMNEMLKQLIPASGRRSIAGGVSGSYPIWGKYQPFRYISWGCKFFADALLLEQRLKQSVEASTFVELPCAS